MKIISFILVLVLSVMLLVSCYTTRKIIDGEELVHLQEIDYVNSDPEFYGVQYIRTDGYNENFEYPRLIKVTSSESLDFYYKNFDGIYYLGHRENVYSDSTIGFADAIEKYSSDFFDSHDLYFAVLEEGSGSVRHNVAGVLDGTSVSIKSISPEICTDDMAEWHIIIEVDKGCVIDKINGKSVSVYTPEEQYEAFLGKLEKCAFDYLESEYNITDAELQIIERTDYATAMGEGCTNPLGYNPGYNESPAWKFNFITHDGLSFSLYLCDSPFVFGSVALVIEDEAKRCY